MNSEKADLQEKVNDLVEKLEEKQYHNMCLTKRVADLERRISDHELCGK